MVYIETDHLSHEEDKDQSTESYSDESFSGDEVIGPLPVEIAEKSSKFLELEKRAASMKKRLLDQGTAISKEPKREEWMTVLPELECKNFGLGKYN